MLYSFDIFDTLISRVTYEPKGIFFLVEQKINEMNITSIDKNFRFSELRVQAEYNARMIFGQSCSIDNIYEELSKNTGISVEALEIVKRAELDMEYNCSLPINSTIDIICDLISNGQTVVFISDMYLHSEQIRTILKKHSKILANIPIYVSCDVGFDKGSGLLFKYVKENEEASYSNWLHVGDNKYSDCIIPGLLGIKTQQIPEPQYCSVGKASVKCIHSTNMAQQIYSKMVLNENDWENEFAIGYVQIGPLLYDYVSWIIDNSIKTGINRLFFIARDGYVIKRIADQIIATKRLAIDTRYIFGSRKSWRVGGDSEQLLVRKYVLQELCNDTSSFAFVDIQGTGYSCDCVSEIIGCTFPVYLYYLVGSPRISKCEKRIFSYNKSGYDTLECICRAPHGTTLGYYEINGKIEPMLSEENVEIKNYETMKKCFDGILTFVKDYLIVQNRVGLEIDLHEISTYILKFIEEEPNKETADYLGDTIHSSENDGLKYAPILTEKDAYLISKDGENYKGFNLALSLYRSSEKINMIFSNNVAKNLSKEPIRIKNNCKYKIVLYGAGERGKKLYRKYNYMEKVEILAWVDAKYDIFRKDGFPIDNPKVLLETEKYDYVVICIANNIENIRLFLMEMGLIKEKIIDCNEFEMILS